MAFHVDYLFLQDLFWLNAKEKREDFAQIETPPGIPEISTQTETLMHNLANAFMAEACKLFYYPGEISFKAGMYGSLSTL